MPTFGLGLILLGGCMPHHVFDRTAVENRSAETNGVAESGSHGAHDNEEVASPKEQHGEMHRMMYGERGLWCVGGAMAIMMVVMVL